MQVIQSIQNRIYTVRGERVMLDFDLAALYEVETKVLNQAVKRNIKRFPEDFMFRLTTSEWQSMRSQNVTASESTNPLRSQFVTLEDNSSPQLSNINTAKGQHSKYLPYAFTEQGIAMLSGILNSDKAINMNIGIMRAFVAIRKIVLQQQDTKEQLREIKERLSEHDVQLSQIYDALENVLDEKASQHKWNERTRIGFRPNE